MNKPNFLIIGDVKAGTTSLHSYLSQHPEIYMPSLTELRYFSYDPENAYHVRAKAYRVRTSAEYFSYFDNIGSAKAVGESSPSYLRSPGAAQRISQTLSDVRLIVSLRNPAERLHSLHQMRQRSGTIAKKPFDEQLFAEDAAWIKGHSCWPELARYFRLFRREQIHVVLFDDLKRDSLAVAQQIYSFLGVSDSFQPDLKAKNTGGMPRNQLVYTLLTNSKNFLRRFGKPPPTLSKAWTTISSKALVHEGIDPVLRRQILQVCADDVARTESLIERDLAVWLK